MMSLESWLGLLGTATSLAGLRLSRQVVTKVAFIFLALVGGTLLTRGIWHQRAIDQVQRKIGNSLGTAEMSADQLYESVYTSDVARQTFDTALNEAVEGGRLAQRMLEVRTPDNLYVRVRVYSVH